MYPIIFPYIYIIIYIYSHLNPTKIPWKIPRSVPKASLRPRQLVTLAGSFAKAQAWKRTRSWTAAGRVAVSGYFTHNIFIQILYTHCMYLFYLFKYLFYSFVYLLIIYISIWWCCSIFIWIYNYNEREYIPTHGVIPMALSIIIIIDCHMNLKDHRSSNLQMIWRVWDLTAKCLLVQSCITPFIKKTGY